MNPAELERFERERQDADRRYNDALTALDRELVSAVAKLPMFRDDASRLVSALLVFLQQITAFVDTKDRRQAAVSASDLARVASSLDAIAELRTQIAVLQRAVRRDVSPVLASDADAPQGGSPIAAPGTGHRAPPPPSDDYKYVAFEDQFRGSGDAIAARLQKYVQRFAGAGSVVDLGCGRGEFLAALEAAGVPARGVDANGDMVAAARARGLDAVRGDALTYLSSIPEGSLGGIIATQVVEHLEPAYLIRLLDAASRALRPGAPIVLETINAACWLAFFSSYIRDITHVRPIHPDTLQYLLRASGFERVTIDYSAPVPEQMKMTLVHLPADALSAADPASRAVQQLAHALNANATILNNLMFTHLDYAASGYRS